MDRVISVLLVFRRRPAGRPLDREERCQQRVSLLPRAAELRFYAASHAPDDNVVDGNAVPACVSVGVRRRERASAQDKLHEKANQAHDDETEARAQRNPLEL